MKNTENVALIFVVMLSGFLAGCGYIPIQKEMLRAGETVSVDIEGYTFYEKLTITEMEEKTKFEIDRSSLRSDEFSKEVGKVFEEKFPIELRARGIIIASGAPKMKISLAYGVRDKWPRVMALVVVMSFEKFEISKLAAFPYLVGKESIPFGEWRDLKNAKVLAERLSEASANAVVTFLREKEGGKSEKK